MWQLVYLLDHAHFVEHFFDSLVSCLLVLPSGSLQYKLEVLAYGTVVEQLEILEDNTQFLAQGGYFLSLDGLEVSAQNLCLFCLAFHEVEFAVEGFQERTLS